MSRKWGFCSDRHAALSREYRGDDLVIPEIFAAPEFLEVSLNQIIRHLTKLIAEDHSNLIDREIDGIRDDKTPVLMRSSLGVRGLAK